MHPIPARRTTAALAALFLVASIGVAGWHRATVLHGTCAQHGEALHFQKVAGVGAVEYDANSFTATGYVPGEGDEHCEILATQHHPVDASAPPQHHAVLESVAAPAVPVALVAIDAASLYRLAPKTSPPVG